MSSSDSSILAALRRAERSPRPLAPSASCCAASRDFSVSIVTLSSDANRLFSRFA